MTNILILGGDGYLGWPTAMHFASNKNNKVIVVDNFIKRKIESEYGVISLINVPDMIDRCNTWNQNNKNKIISRNGDLLNYKFLDNLLKEFKPATIIHYAEQPSAPYSMAGRESATFTQNNNVIGNLNLLFAIKKNCPSSHLIKLGTLGEYGTPNIDIEEGWLELEHNGRKDRVLFPKKPGSFYHLSKVHDSANIEFACRIWGLKCTDLNQGVVYGIFTKQTEMDLENIGTSFHYDGIFGTIINRFITQVVCNKDITVYGNGSQKRGFINIIDTIKCVEIAHNNPALQGEFRVFNQFTESLSLNDMAKKILTTGKMLGYKSKIKHIKNPRIEEENHYYNPKNTSLFKLGLEPVKFDEDTIKKNMLFVEKYKNNVRKAIFEAKIKWKND
jgi:UDP-sulfoquinovose synthase